MAQEREKHLRKHATDAEWHLWRILRNRGVGQAKFRRQQAIGPYVVDFVCHEAGLVIEVDGGQHATADERARNARIESDGYRILRFWNNDVLSNTEGVLTLIEAALRESQDRSSPLVGEEGARGEATGR